MEGKVLTRDEISERFKPIVVDILKVKVNEVTELANFEEDLSADDHDITDLVIRAEDEFGIVIPDEDVEKFVTFGQAVDYLFERMSELS